MTLDLNETLLWGGTSILSVPSILVEDWSGLLVEGPWRGENVVIPGMAGEVGAVKVRDVYTFSVPFTLGSTDGSGASAATKVGSRAQHLANVAALDAIFANQQDTMTRRLTAALTPFYVATTADGEYLGRTITDADSLNMAGVLTFRNLSGGWS